VSLSLRCAIEAREERVGVEVTSKSILQVGPLGTELERPHRCQEIDIVIRVDRLVRCDKVVGCSKFHLKDRGARSLWAIIPRNRYLRIKYQHFDFVKGASLS
jgi:hypothetical protein